MDSILPRDCFYHLLLTQVLALSKQWASHPSHDWNQKHRLLLQRSSSASLLCSVPFSNIASLCKGAEAPIERIRVE